MRLSTIAGVTSAGATIIELEYAIVAGGGGGGGRYSGNGTAGGGAGGGGVLSTDRSGTALLEVLAGDSLTVTVGAGAPPNDFNNSSVSARGNSSFLGVLEAIGGGGGTYGRNLSGGAGSYDTYQGCTGGSGGGGASRGSYTYGYAGTSGQGFAGGSGSGSSAGGGGGGAGVAGGNGGGSTSGSGGNGLGITFFPTSIQSTLGVGQVSGAATYFGGGGSGGGSSPVGGLGGGAAGVTTYIARSGTAYTGGGGAGYNAGGLNSIGGGYGGGGAVVIKFLTALSGPTITAGLSYNTATDGDYTVIAFRSGTGTVTF